jgi:Asp-tRNA(Asn)/Glu-tRNA(Gln) amidotransferase A subunit family amidase
MSKALFSSLVSMFVLVVPLLAADEPVTSDTVADAEKLIGLDFMTAKREMMLDDLRGLLKSYQVIRQTNLAADVLPAVLFNPIPTGMKLEPGHGHCKWSSPAKVKLPKDRNELAFYSVGELAALIQSRQITSVELTHLYLERLKKYGPRLACVVTLTEDRAMRQAWRADGEIAAGIYRGPLHGIPYGVKDLLATRGIPTTWGAAPFKNRIFDTDATVIQRLDKAGAILVAKLSMGELAMGDVWFGGKTRNPWNVAEGSDGSSAGPASATAAGLVGFSIGSETYGSIIAPCTVCGVTGLRPTYGRVSRTGAMSLSWSMDKLGPICRSVEDCAMVLDAIHGPDGLDPTLYDVPFEYRPKVGLRHLRIGYLKDSFDRETNNGNDRAALEKLRSLGARLVPIALPKFPRQITFVLRAEAASAFDELTRDSQDDLLAQQDAGAWPNTFRAARFIPAVEYLRAQRLRTVLIQEMARVMENIDVYVAPSDDDTNLRLTNLTGHPAVVVPDGFSTNGMLTSISFVGKLFGEAKLLAAAKAYQDATGFQSRHPTLVP